MEIVSAIAVALYRQPTLTMAIIVAIFTTASFYLGVRIGRSNTVALRVAMLAARIREQRALEESGIRRSLPPPPDDVLEQAERIDEARQVLRTIQSEVPYFYHHNRLGVALQALEYAADRCPTVPAPADEDIEVEVEFDEVAS